MRKFKPKRKKKELKIEENHASCIEHENKYNSYYKNPLKTKITKNPKTKSQLKTKNKNKTGKKIKEG